MYNDERGQGGVCKIAPQTGAALPSLWPSSCDARNAVPPPYLCHRVYCLTPWQQQHNRQQDNHVCR